jgi:hypothetical protein
LPDRPRSTKPAISTASIEPVSTSIDRVRRICFLDCGITTCTNGTEDDHIHCFKPSGAVPEGRQLLEEARAIQAQLELEEAADKEEDEVNRYLSDESLEL